LKTTDEDEGEEKKTLTGFMTRREAEEKGNESTQSSKAKSKR